MNTISNTPKQRLNTHHETHMQKQHTNHIYINTTSTHKHNTHRQTDKQQLTKHTQQQQHTQHTHTKQNQTITTLYVYIYHSDINNKNHTTAHTTTKQSKHTKQNQNITNKQHIQNQ